ncbi:hypothetical protein Glove_326g26 [Diversispora epigaea]|uniref:Uncharacterized protein n=1 Tax=Diversispora epigaea TaxID=1348612 RepID=A0A397HRD1_9GLOM|nr:hypothetical protein Glove_326g26 [Diversispora epigaea]
MDIFKFFPKFFSLPRTYDPFYISKNISKLWNGNLNKYSSSIPITTKNSSPSPLCGSSNKEPSESKKINNNSCKQKIRYKENTHIHSSSCDSYCYKTMLELSTCPQLSLLSNTNPEYIEIENHFRNTMSQAKIIAIIKIHLPKERTKKYLDLRREMITAFYDEEEEEEEEDGEEEERMVRRRRRNEAAKNWSKKITQRVYHGTRAKCDPNDILEYGICCSDEFCGMCGILNYGNKSKFSKRGKKMWFSKSASIANSFSFNLILPRDYLRTIFVIDVLNVSDNDTDVIIINHDNATLQRFLILYEF